MTRLARKALSRLRRLVFGDPFWRLHARLAREYLRGRGIEVGALHNPVPAPPGATVTYVDRMSKPDLLTHYPDLGARRLVDVGIVDDGERLTTVPDRSQDFVIVNHFLEHTQDPLGALATFFRVLRPGGVLYLSLPDKRYTFDAPRPVTPLAHLRADHEHGPQRSRRAHYEEFVAAAEGLTDPGAVRERADHYERHDYSIHFHVWTQAEMVELLLSVRGLHGFDFELVRKHEHEVVFVMRKHEAAETAPLRQAA